MIQFKLLFPIIALAVVMSVIVGCRGAPGGGGVPTTEPAAPTTAAAGPTSVAVGPTATRPAAAPSGPTEVPPRISPTSPPAAGTPDPSTLAASAGPVCEAAFSKPNPPLSNLSAPETPVLTMLNKEYEGRSWIYNPITKIRYATDARNVRSLLCIVETRKQIDKYDNGAPLYQVTWEARFLRWPDGQVLRVTNPPHMQGGTLNKAFPIPPGNEFYGSRPDEQLLEFVKLAIGS